MPDVFDEISEKLGISRKSAILTYAPSALAELEVALSLLIHLIEPSDIEIAEISRKLEETQIPTNRQDALVLSEAVGVILKHLRSYQLGNSEMGSIN